MVEVLVPDLDGAEEATVTAWLRKTGQTVAKGEPIAELMTDKVNVEVEAPSAGVLTVEVAEGSTVKPGTVLARITAG